MSAIYCKKCGLRGDSKCPHCRSVFSSHHPDPVAGRAQEYLEMFLKVGVTDESEKPGGDGKRRWDVSFWTYAVTQNEAIAKVLENLQQVISTKGVNLQVAACVHDWDIMPGHESSIGCGHKGDPNAVVPPDPYKS